jgi:hypothetical protein
MTNGTMLIAFVGDLASYLASAPVAAATEITTVQRLYGGDLDTLVGPAIGVALTVPQPTIEQRMMHGENALHRWEVSVLVKSPAMNTREEALIYVLDRLGMIRALLDLPGNSFSQLEPATPLYDIYQSDQSTTIAALNYELHWPL